eukprot:scaffold706_cov190-Alexandrium_tamarense.AAC.1
MVFGNVFIAIVVIAQDCLAAVVDVGRLADVPCLLSGHVDGLLCGVVEFGLTVLRGEREFERWRDKLLAI